MRSEFLGAVVCICAAVVAVKYFDSKAQSAGAGERGDILASATAPSPSKSSESGGIASGREVRLAAGANHQYFVTAAVNKRPASFLVDTGASYVALRESDARAANIFIGWADYKHPVRTANGETKAALIKLATVEIDGIRVENVDAFVLPDEQLGMNLLGMSFLSRLESVESRSGELVLKG